MEITLVKSPSQLIQILKLQNENHFGNLSKSEQSKAGFVTVKHDIDMLKQMNQLAPQIVDSFA